MKIEQSEVWRDQAIEEAIRQKANSRSSLDALLCAIHPFCPDAQTLMVWVDRLQLLQFLATEASGLRSLLHGGHSHVEREQVCPYVGWYSVCWEDQTIEIAFTPSASNDGCALLIGSDAQLLLRFAQKVEHYTLRPAGRCLRYSDDWENAPDFDAELGRVTWDDLILPSTLLASIRESIEGFYNHRESFAALGFPWRRGILLVGPPGTGKTMVCKAAAAALAEIPFLYVRDLHSTASEGEAVRDAIATIFERARKLAPCILAFEDIDGLIDEKNRTVFLNELDGFHNNNGLLIIASSNHPERIDEALLKRPSRFDRVYHLGLPAQHERYTFCLRLLSRSELAQRLSPELQVELLARQVAQRTDGFTPAYLKEVFIAAALQRAQSGATILDLVFHETVLAQIQELRSHMRRLRNPEALAELSASADLSLGFVRAPRGGEGHGRS